MPSAKFEAQLRVAKVEGKAKCVGRHGKGEVGEVLSTTYERAARRRR